MTTLQLLFPAGRYHATPWGRNPNEGEVEWPPSPWRLLRALVAVWHRRAAGEIEASVMEGLLAALASELPCYRLPQPTLSHTRHYMPDPAEKQDGEFKPRLTFDAAYQLPADAPLCVIWRGLTLPRAQEEALRLLASRLTFLGRAESWADARVIPDDAAGYDAEPVEEGQAVEPGWERVELLAPLSPDAYSRVRAGWIAARVEEELGAARRKLLQRGQDPGGAKLSVKQRQALDSELPEGMLAVLEAEASALQKQGWTLPPGTRRVVYVRRPRQEAPRPVRVRPPARAASAAPEGALPQVARFAVTTRVPLRLTTGLLMAEKVHRHLVRLTEGRPAPVFTGQDAVSRAPLADHQHAHLFWEGWGRPDGGVTHLTIYAPMGFDDVACEVLRQLPTAGLHDLGDLRLALIGLGSAADFAGLRGEAGQCPLLVESAVWRSVTPFVPTRLPKFTRAGAPRLDEVSGLQKGSPEHDLRRLVEAAGLPSLLAVEPVAAGRVGGAETPWHHFRTQRIHGEGSRGRSAGHGFRLRFAAPVRGPLALGYAAHFGLGLFGPDA